MEDTKSIDRKTKVGLGNKAVDRFLLVFNVLLFSGSALLFHRYLFLVPVMAVIAGFNCLRIVSKYYISYSDGYFIVDHVFRRHRMIKSDQYVRVSADPISLPFSNTMVIHFRNGLSYSFNGGLQNFRRIDMVIKRLLNDEA